MKFPGMDMTYLMLGIMRTFGVFILSCVVLVSSAPNVDTGMKLVNASPKSTKPLSKKNVHDTPNPWTDMNPFFTFTDNFTEDQTPFLIRWLWVDNNITYKIHRYSERIDKDYVDKSIALAFSRFSRYIPLTFTQVTDDCAHINIRWRNKTGYYGTTTHASNRLIDVTFDDEQPYDTNCGSFVCLWTVAVHEFGHALGLGHFDWDSAQSVMDGGQDVGADDIIVLQMLYGDKEGAMPGVRPLLQNLLKAEIGSATGSCSHVPIINYKYDNHKFDGSLITKYCSSIWGRPPQCLLVGCEAEPGDEKCFPVFGLLVKNKWYSNHVVDRWTKAIMD